MIRKTEKAAVANLRGEIEKIAALVGARVEFYKKDSLFTFPDYDDGEIYLGHCKNEKEVEGYTGIQYDDICIEEATQMRAMEVELLKGSNRPTVPGCIPRFWCTTNPGGPGHGWYKRFFVSADTRPPNVLWIPGLLEDALPSLEIDPGYYDRTLAGLPHWKKEQWANGNWDVQAGNYFDIPPTLVQRVTVPPYAKWFDGIDWGYWPDPFAVLLGARWQENNGKERLHIQAEYRGWRLNPDMQADKALDLEMKTFDQGFMMSPVKVRYADPECWRQGRETLKTEVGRTIAGMWAKSGMPVHRAKTNARVPTWAAIRQCSANRILTIDPSCRGLIEEMTDAVPEGTGDHVTGEDIHRDCEEHLLRCLGYILLSTLSMERIQEAKDAYEQWREKRSATMLATRHHKARGRRTGRFGHIR